MSTTPGPTSRSSPTSGVRSPTSDYGRSRSSAPARSPRRGHLGAGLAARAGQRRAARPDGDPGARRGPARPGRPEPVRYLDVDRFPSSTLEALALANRAYRTDLQVGERASFALRDALFEEGRDISDPCDPRIPSRDLGVTMSDESDRAAVLADWHEGGRRGVLGSPHFFCGDTDVFCPSLDITKDPVEGVSIVRDVSRLTEFLERCLARPGPA